MAPTDSPNQSSEHTADAKPEQPQSSNDKPGEAQPETAQSQPSDPSVTGMLQSAVSGPDKLTDPSTEERFRKAA
ncbi:hypothetical protein G7Y89_g9064 [Cudoniella acicularis]|uniref:Uncharacterized protein n=1 Tax=Cudoniella acicularis TaxID=354080 RepID=A0A8H4RI59_9HELO|nr:hypothetical protein G7Y89_g9064 [Cudoniella acicularis]